MTVLHPAALPEIQIDGKRVYVYQLVEGMYSDEHQDWWYHERQMTTAELVQLLIDSSPLAEAVEREHLRIHGAAAREYYHEACFRAREALLGAAGFSPLLPQAVFEHEHAPYWAESVDSVRERLLDAQREASKP